MTANVSPNGYLTHDGGKFLESGGLEEVRLSAVAQQHVRWVQVHMGNPQGLPI